MNTERVKANLKQWNGGNLMRAVGMAGKDGTTGKTQPAEQGTAGGHSQRILRPAQASTQTHGPQLAGLAAKTQPQMTSASRRAGKWGECDGTQKGGCRPTYPVPTPPNAFACHCPYPLS